MVLRNPSTNKEPVDGSTSAPVGLGAKLRIDIVERSLRYLGTEVLGIENHTFCSIVHDWIHHASFYAEDN